MHSIARVSRVGILLLFAGACGGGGDATAPRGTVPTIVSITPSQGTVGTELTITGTDFRTGATVQVGGTAATSVDLSSSTTIYARIPAGVTAGQHYAVTVMNADGTSAKRDTAFTPIAPVLKYVNGATRPSGNVGSTLIIEGSAFGDAPGTISHVYFSNGAGGTIAAAIADSTDWTDTFIITTVPSGAASGDIAVQTATGTSAALPFVVTSNAPFSPSTITWTATTSLPVGLSGHNAQVAMIAGATATTSTSLIYVTGGADSTYAPRTDVRFATILASGQIGAWTSTAAMPAAVAFHGSVIATPFNSRVKGTGFIYVLGGATDAAGTPSATIYRGALASDGTVSAWTTAGALPAPLHAMGAVIFRGDIYVVGGSTTGNAPVNTVYRARLDSLGALGAWQTEAPLPSKRSYHGVVQFGGYLYTVGGDTSTVTPNDSSVTGGAKLSQVAYAKIDLRSADITTAGWVVNASSTSKAVAKHTVIAAGGSLLVTAGLYNGASTGSSEQAYAQINSDGTVSSFSGATGAHTITSAGGKDLFNHAAVAYTDATGISHVLVLGGDDVNAPGKKRAEVWYY